MNEHRAIGDGAPAPRGTSSAQARRTCILVLGMHRSGTSAVTRVVSLLGAALPKTLLGANRGNEAGHWEPERLIALHDKLLAAMGSHWDDWRALDPGSLSANDLAEYRHQLAELIESEYAGSALFVIKEPRICRFAPVFERQLEDMGIEARFVLPIRNPLAVVSSLRKRDGLTEGHSGLLWLRHVLDAEAATRDRPRAILSYEALLADWRAAAGTISARLGVAWPVAPDAAAPEVDSFLRRELQHFAPSRGELMGRSDVAAWVKEAYEALLRLERDPDEETALAALDGIRGPFEAACPAFGVAMFAELGAREARFQGRLRQHEEDAKALRATIATREADIAGLRAEISAKDQEIGALRATMGERDGNIAAFRADILAKEKEIGALRARLGERDGESQRLHNEVAARDKELIDLRKRLTQREDEAKTVKRQLTASLDLQRAYEASTSWRVTMPLRWAKSTLARILDRGPTTLSVRAVASRSYGALGLPQSPRIGGPRHATAKVDTAPSRVDGLAAKAPAEPGSTGTPSTPAVANIVRLNRNSTPATRPFVSIIILTRNGAGLLNQLFQSFVKTNSYTDFEIIIVDHKSTDATAEVVSYWKRHLPIRNVTCHQNHSFAYSNNRAAEIAKGALLLFLNNDIVFTCDAIPSMVSAISDQQTGIVGLKQFSNRVDRSGTPEYHHIGIRFRWDLEGRFLRPYNASPTPTDSLIAQAPVDFWAVTASIMMCRKADYFDLGGFCERYTYGFEDVDFCLRMKFGAGKHVVSLNSHSAVHLESVSRNVEDPQLTKANRLGNTEALKARIGYALRQQTKSAGLTDDGSLIGRKYRVAFAVSSADPDSGVGDLFTAQGLGEALKDLFGWDTAYLPPEEWNKAENVDLYIAMNYKGPDIQKLSGRSPQLVTMAWIRNWVDRWVSQPWFHHFDLVGCSSSHSVKFVRKHDRPDSFLLPIGFQRSKFHPLGTDANAQDLDYVFTGNNWNAPIPREVESYDPGSVPFKFSVFGRNWRSHPTFGKYDRGFIDYDSLNGVYSNAKLVIDDSVTHVTKPWGSMNSRVFEALASGALVLTNNEIGSTELFGGELPVWRSAADLSRLLSHYLSREEERRQLALRLQERVLAEHSYHHRATVLLEHLRRRLVDKLRFGIKCPVPNFEEAEAWGDYHLAHSLRKYLLRRGHCVRVDILPDWYSPAAVGDDVVIVLRGLSEYQPSKDQINIMWNISHPERVSAEEYEAYDHVFVASDRFARKLANNVSVAVSSLLQCSDPEVFHPLESDVPAPEHPVLFVGNSRKQKRWMVTQCLHLGVPVTIYGRDWSGLVPRSNVLAEHIPNRDLHRYYAGAKIVLNDHWPDMAAEGFISNRIFDAALSGAFVISDEFEGSEIFEGNLVTCSDASQLAATIHTWLGDLGGRQRMARRLRELVLSRHTMDHRAEEILSVINNLHKRRVDAPRDAPLREGEHDSMGW